jgi:hypothetical protein
VGVLPCSQQEYKQERRLPFVIDVESFRRISKSGELVCHSWIFEPEWHQRQRLGKIFASLCLCLHYFASLVCTKSFCFSIVLCRRTLCKTCLEVSSQRDQRKAKKGNHLPCIIRVFVLFHSQKGQNLLDLMFACCDDLVQFNFMCCSYVCAWHTRETHS